MTEETSRTVVAVDFHHELILVTVGDRHPKTWTPRQADQVAREIKNGERWGHDEEGEKTRLHELADRIDSALARLGYGENDD